MNPAIVGPTASHYRLCRRDVPGTILDRLLKHLGEYPSGDVIGPRG